ncbi:MAG: NPCBM/NEW2 domain-containing protein [Pirellulaceae bacterium]
MAGIAAVMWLVLSVGPAVAPAPVSVSPQEVVYWDWYLRESLVAIDDWEQILAQRETDLGRDTLVPLLPLPADGQLVNWPNPVPLRLLPAADRARRVQVRLVESRVDIARDNVGGQTDGVPSRDSVPLGESIAGYHHPGGGGRDQWNHVYERRFDRLCAIVARTAPFAVQLESLPDFAIGQQQITLNLRNATAAPLTLSIGLTFYQRERGPQSPVLANTTDASSALQARVVARAGEKQTVHLAGNATQAIQLPFALTTPGGGLLVLDFHTDTDAYRIPLFTHVEDVPALLTGVRQMLADTPDAAAETQLADMSRQVDTILQDGPPNRGDAWRALFVRASELRDKILLRRLDFSRLLFVKRKPFFSEQPFMDAHHCYNRPGGGIYCLEPVAPTGRVTPVVNSLGLGIYRDLSLHWQADRLLFSFGNGSDRVAVTTRGALTEPDGKRDYDLYEVQADGKALRQLTSSPKNDCEPFYLPDGRIGFTSDRSEHVVMCGSDIHVANLFTMSAAGSDVRQLSYNTFNEFNPSVLPDGRIIYNRWEYNERSVTSLHNLFTIHPDGTHTAPYYGNATYRPNVIMFPRAVPQSAQVMALFTAHHGQTHGPLGLIDVQHGVDGAEPLTILTPGVPVVGERIEDSRRGWYSDPQPLSPTTYLCSFTPTVLPWLENSWALYVGDRHGNLALVYRDLEISCAEPVPWAPRPSPRTLVASANDEADEALAHLLMADVYVGLPGVPRGTARYLRIIEDVPRKGVPTGGVICTAGTSIYTIKRVLGTVPIADDGSANFVVPSDRNVYFEVLDARQREIQRMRSVLCLKPNEQRTCIGCHESRTTAPPVQFASAFHRTPDVPSPPPWGTQILSYLRDIQPMLNERCVACHTHDRVTNHVILTDDLTDQFTVGYEELLPYLSVANAMRWDYPDDVFAQPPYTYGSCVSPLVKLLESGHYDVALTSEQWERLVTWIDTNAVYYDRYESDAHNRRIFVDQVRSEMEAVYARRCADCHGEKDEGRQGNWWMSLNRRDVAHSRMLIAPLSRSAGGWQRCGEAVFADANDPDYQRLLAALMTLRDSLAAEPRADLLSLRGTPAERQVVNVPAPPPASPAERPPLAGDWIALSDLSWQTARAGWTPNQDGLPRRDKSVDDRPLRLGPRLYRKGLGTHAPSEMTFALEGRFRRFAAVVGGGEVNGTVVFQVYGDDKLLFDSGLLRGMRDIKSVDVSVEDVRQLRLIVTDAGDGYISDMATWADARLERTAKAQ